MRILFFAAMLFLGCGVMVSEPPTNPSFQPSPKGEGAKQPTSDSVYLVTIDSLRTVLKECQHASEVNYTRLRDTKDTLMLCKAQIANVRKYLNICLKNPSQDKFLKGWVRRAIE